MLIAADCCFKVFQILFQDHLLDRGVEPLSPLQPVATNEALNLMRLSYKGTLTRLISAHVSHDLRWLQSCTHWEKARVMLVIG